MAGAPGRRGLVALTIGDCSLGGQGSEDDTSLGEEALGNDEAGGDGGSAGPDDSEASGEVKRDHADTGGREPGPEEWLGRGRGGREAAQHQAAQSHSDQALKTRGAMSF